MATKKTKQASGDRRGEEKSLGNLGITYRSLGQIKKARQYFEQSLSILEKIKSPYADLFRQKLAELEAESQ